MTSASPQAFERARDAAEELATLGYAAQSELVWRSAFATLVEDTRVDASSVEAIQRLLAEDVSSAQSWTKWQERARALATTSTSPTPARSSIAALAIGGGLFTIALITFVAGLGRAVVVSSGDYAPETAAALAFDGNESSEWLLPDGARGHLEAAFARPRAVHRVVLTNGHNAPYNDRAVRKARIVVLDDDREVDSAQVSFAKVEQTSERRAVELAGKRGTRVRIIVLEYFGLGSAVAEVTIE